MTGKKAQLRGVLGAFAPVVCGLHQHQHQGAAVDLCQQLCGLG